MDSISNIFKKITQIFYLGITDDMPFIEVQRTFMFNLYLMTGLPFIIPGIPINFTNGQYHLAYMNCFLFVLYITGIWVNLTRKYLWTRGLVVILAACVFSIGPILYRNGTEYVLLMSIMSAVIIFESNLLFILFSLAVIAAVTYIRVRDVRMSGINSYAAANPYVVIFFTQILYVISIYSFKYIYFKYQKQLTGAYENLKKSKEAKDKVLRVVAHDLRSPVGGIAALSTIILDGMEPLTQDQQNYLKTIQRTSTESLNLINELLQNDTEDVSAPVISETNINSLLTNVVQLLQHKATEKKLSVVLLLPDKTITGLFDHKKISRVMQNLLSNAIKFTHTSGRIVISAKVEKNQLHMDVEDNGIGIPEKWQPNLFDMFSKAQRKGTEGEESFGIGLSVCKKIIEEHEGIIIAESGAEKGTIFKITLPFVSS